MNEVVSSSQTEKYDEEFEAMRDFVGVLGGLGIIYVSQLVFYLSGYIAYWIATIVIGDHSLFATSMEVLGLPVIIMLICGMIAVGLMIVFWLLPVDSEFMNMSLMRSAGLILVSLPLVPIGGYFLTGSFRGFIEGSNWLNWLLFPFIGLIFLSLPRLGRHGELGDNKTRTLILAGASLGLLTSILFLYGMYTLPGFESSPPNYPTHFSLVGLTAGLAILVHSVLMPFIPNQFGIKNEE